jgi:branched-chain amino acid transport system ATP-binding protein
MPPVLSIDNVSKRFGSVRAVDGVTLTVDENEIRGIVGPNGAGKTTLFNIITGFLGASSGTASYRGQTITNQPIHRLVRRGIARTFQTPQLFREITVFENVMVGAYASILDRRLKSHRDFASAQQKANDVLEFVGLGGSASLVAGELPYPAQRLLEIARALMTDPSLLLLDEPAAGMNASEALKLTQLIKDIRGQNRTVVVIEHNMRLIMEISDRVTVINFGQVIAEGPPAVVRADPKVITAYLGASA